jgi:hypothetical protein
MTETRIKFSNIVQNQFPAYVREEFPLVVDFISQYYLSQESKGSSSDLIQNIDQYIKLDNQTNQTEYAILSGDISSTEDIIDVSFDDPSNGTYGFPNNYGLIQIGDEIITYSQKTDSSFVGCVRGFSGITSLKKQNHPDELVFSTSESTSHSIGSKVINLSSLFLKEFLIKSKYQLTPGFENRSFSSGLNQSLFIKQAKDFYRSKGTDESFRILFNSLYGQNVEVIKPKNYLFRPSDAQYRVTKDIIVESISGDPLNLTNATLRQDEYGSITEASSPITKVEKIVSGEGNAYYKLSLDANYNRDITVDGAIYGNFSIHPKTKLIGKVSAESVVLDVDSTVGFPKSGELSVEYEDLSVGIVSYVSKSITQFIGCSNITNTILDGSNIGINTYAYATVNKGTETETIKVRIGSVLENLDIVDDTYYFSKGNTSSIKSLGIMSKDAVSNNWFFNLATSYEVESFKLSDISDYTYTITTKNNNIFKVGDNLKIIGQSGVEKTSKVISIDSPNSFKIKGQGILLESKYTVKRNLSKVNSNYSELSLINTNVQNIYKIKDRTLVASPSLPSYNGQKLEVSNKSITLSGTFVGDEFTITSLVDHGFYTGDSVYYTPEKIISSGINDSDGNPNFEEIILSSLFAEGIYFIKRINNTKVKFARSRSDIYNSKFISLDTPTQVNQNTIQFYDFSGKFLRPQKLLREISQPTNDGKTYPTEPGLTGILINGTEILNYKSKDVVYYGPIENIEVLSPGAEYDIINPPTLIISDTVGTGATGYCAVMGSLKEIRIISNGFDYVEEPIIKITGGNGIGAKAKANMTLISHQSSFNSEASAQLIGIGSALSTIGFSTYHKFRNCERVIYKTSSQRGVGGLSTNSSYYVSVQSPTVIKLHETKSDAISGINTVSLTSFGIGSHIIESYDKKSVIKSINILDSGSGYENKKRTVSIAGINTSISTININDHQFKSGEVVKYTNTATPIGGLSTNTNYYVTKVSDDSFKLSQVGFGTDNVDFYYNTKQYVNFTSTGSGTHTFNYPEISVEVIGNIGVSSVSNETFAAVVQPIFRGEITSIHLSNKGSKYGSSEVLNYRRDPLVTLNSGTSAQLTPIISNGKIVEVLPNISGKNYNSPPTLNVIGDGVGAVIVPIIENGQIISVKVIEGGTGYRQESTQVSIVSAGSGAKFNTKIKTWNVNLYQKYFNNITADDGFINIGLNEEYQLQYSHLYAPRKLREIIYSLDQGGKILYGKTDLKKINDIESVSTDHSPIIGWAYDGNPIYGPYGYATNQGGVVVQMKSGYKLTPSSDRPVFPEGFFVEDYTYFEVSDESYLDENNGRFCKTPEFPNGTYAYFATINNSSADSSGPFVGYKHPVFPYLIGNNFRSKPNEFNFKPSSNQDEIDLNATNWVRNTQPYNSINNYSYLTIPNQLNQTVDVKFAEPGTVDNIEVVAGGINYQVNDSVVFDEEDTGGYGLSARVSRIEGKEVNSISVASTTLSGLEFYPSDQKGFFKVISPNPHNFKNKDLVTVSGLSTTSSLIEGSYIAGVSTNTFVLASNTGINSSSITGIVTYISISGDISKIRENDTLSVDSEIVKVLNIDLNSSRIRILRGINGTIGSSHTTTSTLYQNPRELSIDVGFNTSYNYKINKEIYFNPIESVGLGTAFGVGIGSTIVFSNPGVGITQIFIPTKTIYIPNHNLETGDKITYYSNGGAPISVSSNGISTTLTDQSVVYIAKISSDLIGISSVKVGLGSTGTIVGVSSTTSNISTFYFTGIGTGTYHSFKTNYSVIVGQISKNTVTVSTAQTHGLVNNDSVFVDVNPSISTSFAIKYNDYNRKLVANPKSFSASGINTQTSAITIPKHKFVSGQQVIYTSSTPSGGLVNNKVYYAIIVDENNIKLSDTYYHSVDLNPTVVGITSASDGTISAVNPPIEVYRNSTVTFDLSDSSLSYTNSSTKYSAFKFNFYKDSNFTELFDSTKETGDFEVKRYGIVGITNSARVVLTVNEYLPEKLYYNLVPIYEYPLSIEKEEITTDSTVFSNNQIQVKFSDYNGKQNIISTSSTSFTYNLPKYPESPSYTSSTGSLLNYETDSSNTYGPISKVKITSSGGNYYDLPSISSVTSDYGSGSILESHSNSIGKIKKSKINDIGFDFPTDFTLKPNVKLTQIAKIEPLASFQSIGITSFGRGYSSPAKLLVFDGKTNEIVSGVDLKYNLGDSQVTILKNTYGLYNTKPKILPTQNSNGVGISSISYNSTSKNVTVILAVGFSTSNSFPFAVNDKVLIENISIGVGSDSKGYNSENYDYQLFTINSVTENIGGFGQVTYSLNGLLNSSEYPGTFDAVNSSGRIIPEKYFPIFNPILQTNDFLQGEVITTPSAEGIVEQWNPKTTYLKIRSNQDFGINEIVEGSSSKSKGLITSNNNNINAFFNLNSSSKFENGWESSAGVLNDNLQRVQDSLYYQNFSYSLKSEVDYDSWKDAVGTLNHTLGFKKFSDYQLNSSLYYNKSFVEKNSNNNSLTPVLTSNLASIDITNNIIGFADLNCVYDFDLVKENSLIIGENSFSDEIIFSSKILTDYFESVGNRVLSIDDISYLFNSNPRPTKFSEVHRFFLADYRAQKYITYVRDKRFTAERQIMLLTVIHDGSNGYLSQYARNETYADLGSFDFAIDGSEGLLIFYPIKYSINDYDITTLSYNLSDSLSGVGSTSFGGVADIQTNSVSVSSGSTTILNIENTYTSAKVLVEITSNDNEYEFVELNVLHNGTEVQLLEYGQLKTHSYDELSSSGLGTFSSYLTGSKLKIDFFPNVGLGVTINTIQIALANSSYSGIGTYDMKHSRLEARTVSISSTSSPVPVVISDYPDEYDGAYFIVQASDTTNNIHQLSEVVMVDDGTETYSSEFATINTFAGIGTVGSERIGTTTQLTFTPLPDIDVNVNVFLNALRYEDDTRDVVDFINASIETNYATYEGADRDIRRSFDLYYENNPIFQKGFDASDPLIVNIESNTIEIPNHFFVTGELINYSNSGAGTSQSIEISPTNFVGIGTTDKLPSDVYVVKVNDNIIKLSASAEDALKFTPITLDLTGVGIGTYHTFTGNNQNAKLLVSIDNVIQSPIVSTAVTTTLAINAFTTDDILFFTGITSFFGGDLIKVGDEIMRVDGIGIGSTNAIKVRRPWLGTVIAGYSTGELVTKIVGNYNIVDNTLNFVEAPYGNLPYGTTTNPPDERDWLGITTSSRFQGRSFLRSGEVNTTNETYYKNYSFDDISSEFTGSNKSFELRSNRSSITGISDQNGIILINDIFQGPGVTYDYNLSENVGMTSITFTGTATSIANDVNTASIPAGGIIVSVGSTEGFGYQPLVSAGGTAVVSIAGTISSISIGNSGSGYRSGVQVVRVGVGTSSTGTPNIQFIGTASISNGHITGVAITNPGVGYSISNPPYVIFDAPLSYSNIPLIYNSSYSGIGTEATIDVVVGQGSNVIDFEIRNTGYSYGQGDVLTLPIGGTVGIPTVVGSSFNEFQISIQNTFTDKFSGWSIGELQVLDSFSHLFNGERVVFPIKYLGDTISIRSARGSNIKVQDTLLVFINDILQVPGQSYLFPGGSMITFAEAPKSGDTLKILFYKGSGDIDVIFRNILETVKIGDELTISYDPSIGQGSYLQEDTRNVTSVDSTDLVSTNPYFGPGNTTNETLVRPVVWCRQTEDMIINEQGIGKDRMRYEPIIDPVAYLIQSVGIGTTIVYVDNVRPFFNPVNENDVSLSFQKSVSFISQDTIVSASATAVVSSAGTISSLIISNGGYGYTNNPIVTIQSPVGVGSTAIVTSTIVSGIVSSFTITGVGSGYTSTNPPSVLIEPPTFKTEKSFVTSYQGDSGVIVGFGITSISGVTKLIFDTFIPDDSYLQQPSIVGTAITISGLTASQYFMVYDSNVGFATTSIVSTRTDGSTIGIGTYFVDNVYQVDSSQIIGINVTGVGFTYVNRLFARVTGVSTISFGPTYSGIIGTSHYFGNFSWGKIVLSGPIGINSYSFYGNRGVGGISTSTIVKRTVPLKYKNYIT